MHGIGKRGQVEFGIRKMFFNIAQGIGGDGIGVRVFLLSNSCEQVVIPGDDIVHLLLPVGHFQKVFHGLVSGIGNGVLIQIDVRKIEIEVI